MPNERLTLEALRERYRVGWSPIREALMRLEADGLVTFEQNKGFRVAAVSRKMLADLMRSRIEIEIYDAAVVYRERQRRLGGGIAGGIPSLIAAEQVQALAIGQHQPRMDAGTS